jgi:hypothetical protein
MPQETSRATDPDLVEGPPTDHAQGNENAPALNEDGLPNDEVAIAEDVIGANADETQG